MDKDTSSLEATKKQPTPPSNPAPAPKNSDSQQIHFWILDRKILTLNLFECESLWELQTGLLLHPLVMLFPNFQFAYQNRPIGPVTSLTDYLRRVEAPRDCDLRIDLVPTDANIQQTRHALLAFVRLVKRPKEFLSNQMMKFFEVIGRQDFISQVLGDLAFDCEEMLFEDALTADVQSAQQFLRLQKSDKGSTLKLSQSPTETVKELQFLRKLILPPDTQVNLQGFEEYFEVLVETMERKHLGFVFCKRGVYLSRRFEQGGHEVSLRLLSLPRESRRRLTGFYPSMIPLLMQESPAFAGRFQELIERDLTQAETGGVGLLLDCSLGDVRSQYKHWLKPNSRATQRLLGEGSKSNGRNPTANGDTAHGRGAAGAADSEGQVSDAQGPQ